MWPMTAGGPGAGRGADPLLAGRAPIPPPVPNPRLSLVPRTYLEAVRSSVYSFEPLGPGNTLHGSPLIVYQARSLIRRVWLVRQGPCTHAPTPQVLSWVYSGCLVSLSVCPGAKYPVFITQPQQHDRLDGRVPQPCSCCMRRDHCYITT